MTPAPAAPLTSVYRTHTCASLGANDVNETVTLSGWIFRRRDHGGVAFVDLRDHYGVTQVVFHPESGLIDDITHTSLETVIKVTGTVVKREDAQINPNMATGEIEVDVKELTVLGPVEKLPYALEDESIPEELRLTNRPLDLRRPDMHANIMLRSDIIAHIRQSMWAEGFKEYATPIMTSSSPEGARDFLVPSRLHPGKFYALPQAPQQFKQLLMISGFDRYFQIAPCFRDEDPRADRSPTEFYQLDMEMSFVDQDDVFAVNERVIGGLFDTFADWNGHKRRVDPRPWVRIPYDEAMLKYGSDKPDLRVSLEMTDVSDVFEKTDFAVFKNIIAGGGHVRAIPAPKATDKPRSWFDCVGKWAVDELGAAAPPWYFSLSESEFKGPLFKFLGEEIT